MCLIFCIFVNNMLQLILTYTAIILLSITLIGTIICVLVIPYFLYRNEKVYLFLSKLNVEGYDIRKLKQYNKILYSLKKIKIENYKL